MLRKRIFDRPEAESTLSKLLAQAEGALLPMIRTQGGLVMATALFLLVTANSTFLRKISATYALSAHNAGFLMSLVVLAGALMVFLISPWTGRFTTKPLITLWLLIGASSAYFTDRFGVVIDDVMIQNLLETNPGEASDLITVEFIVRWLLLGLLPVVFVWRLPIAYRGWRVELRSKLLTIVSALFLMVAILFAFSSHYASFFREHKALRYYANPTYPLYSLVKYGLTWGRGHGGAALVRVAEDAHIPETDSGRELVIMEVGETVRADRLSLNGYARETTPLLVQESNLFSYQEVTACGTSTVVSVPCMFAQAGRETFDGRAVRYTENVLDVLTRIGVSVLWRDNNSDSKGVAVRVLYEDFQTSATNPVCDVECRDVGMLSGLQEFIDRQPSDILIILHQMGNHGPSYFKRYPAAFERFTPACHSGEFSECSLEEIGNAYDNAILYTDWFLTQVIALLKVNTPAFETTMLYVSDHGESLGEKGIFLHGFPYALAPDAQTRVPMLLWLGENSDVEPESVLARLGRPTSHDTIFHSLLELFEVKSAAADRDVAMFRAGDPADWRE